MNRIIAASALAIGLAATGIAYAATTTTDTMSHSSAMKHDTMGHGTAMGHDTMSHQTQ